MIGQMYNITQMNVDRIAISDIRSYDYHYGVQGKGTRNASIHVEQWKS